MLRKCKSFDCSNLFKIHTNCFSISFVFYDDIDYEMMNRDMFQKNAEYLCLCCFRAFVLLFYDLKNNILIPTNFYLFCIFEVHHNVNAS